jgi:hypothetical protein
MGSTSNGFPRQRSEQHMHTLGERVHISLEEHNSIQAYITWDDVFSQKLDTGNGVDDENQTLIWPHVTRNFHKNVETEASLSATALLTTRRKTNAWIMCGEIGNSTGKKNVRVPETNGGYTTCNGPNRAKEFPINPSKGNFSKPQESSGSAALLATSYAPPEDGLRKVCLQYLQHFLQL